MISEIRIKFICSSSIYFLVYGQFEFNLTTKNGDVSKNVGESVTLQWNITKERNTDTLADADLFLLNPKRLLYYLISGQDKPFPSLAKEIFGERISASLSIDKNIYQLTLQNLKYNDTGSFLLEIGLKREKVTISKEAAINLRVKGMANIFFLFQKR